MVNVFGCRLCEAVGLGSGGRTETFTTAAFPTNAPPALERILNVVTMSIVCSRQRARVGVRCQANRARAQRSYPVSSSPSKGAACTSLYGTLVMP
jgi:hypothetical protein